MITKSIKHLFSVILIVITVFLITSFLYPFLIDNLNRIGGSSKRVNLQEENEIYKIVVVLVVPFIEEILYRLGLKFSIRNTTFLLLGIIYTLYLFFQPSNMDFNNPVVLLVFLSSFIGTFFILRFLVKRNSVIINEFYITNGKFIFWLSILVFAFSHLTLHDNHNSFINIVLSPFILLPYLIAGFVYGKIRLQYGFFWGYFAHVFWNFLVAFKILTFFNL